MEMLIINNSIPMLFFREWKFIHLKYTIKIAHTIIQKYAKTKLIYYNYTLLDFLYLFLFYYLLNLLKNN